jgi:hypothetical protein
MRRHGAPAPSATSRTHGDADERSESWVLSWLAAAQKACGSTEAEAALSIVGKLLK